MTKDEVQGIGADKINERGHQFHYTLGPLKEVEPAGWDEMSRCWFIEISSPELKNLRKSYGLSPLPNGDHPFHATVAVRRKHILKNNDVKKAEVLKMEAAMDKGASIIMPLIRAGGLYTDVAGIRALTAGQKEQPPDPAEEVENDTSYLNQLRPKRKKKPRVVSAETSLTPLSMRAKLAEAVKMIPMQGHGQENDYSCGPGALKTLFDHYDKGESEHKIREATDADPEEGTRPEELAEHAEDKGLDAEVIEHTSFSDLEQMVDSGEPVICNIQAWGNKEDYPKDESGHYVVLTGYDADKFYFKDPALGDKPGELLRQEMGERWHDQEADGDKTDRLAIPIRKRGNTHPPVVRTRPPEAKKIASQSLRSIGQ